MQGRLPRGTPLDVLPLAQVAGDGVTQHGDVVEVPERRDTAREAGEHVIIIIVIIRFVANTEAWPALC